MRYLYIGEQPWAGLTPFKSIVSKYHGKYHDETEHSRVFLPLQVEDCDRFEPIHGSSKMYVFVARHLSPIQKGVQAAHAVAEFVFEHKEISCVRDWVNLHKTLVMLDVSNNIKFLEIQQALQAYGVKFTEFKEPDLGNITTAIAVIISTEDEEGLLEYVRKFKTAI